AQQLHRHADRHEYSGLGRFDHADFLEDELFIELDADGRRAHRIDAGRGDVLDVLKTRLDFFGDGLSIALNRQRDGRNRFFSGFGAGVKPGDGSTRFGFGEARAAVANHAREYFGLVGGNAVDADDEIAFVQTGFVGGRVDAHASDA